MEQLMGKRISFPLLDTILGQSLVKQNFIFIDSLSQNSNRYENFKNTNKENYLLQSVLIHQRPCTFLYEGGLMARRMSFPA